MGSLSRFRKAYGALKDSTSVSLAKLKSDFKDLDIAIVKATNHVEAPPKERHVRKIFAATTAIRPRADVAYCIYALSRRLRRTRSWIVAIKVLIVIHRALREGDPTFREELMNYSYNGHILHMANFKDDSSNLAADCSEWVRSYALYIEERLECIRTLKYDIEDEQLTRDFADATQVYSGICVFSIDELLDQLPALQELLYRIVGCQPEGRACTNYLLQYSLSLVLKESFTIYHAINDGILNLVNTYFEMPKHDAVRALSIHKRAGKQAEILADFYDFCKRLELGRNFEFPTLIKPLPSFLATMEVYVKEEPQTSSNSRRQPTQDLQERDGSQHENPEEAEEQLGLDEEKVSEEKQENSKPIRNSEFPNLISVDDLLGLNDMVPKAEEVEESNALVLFNTSTGNDLQSLNSGVSDPDTTGWELALFSAPSNDSNNANLGDGFNKLLEGTLMQNPFQQQQDAFAISNSIALLTNMQMTSLAQQKQQQMLQQQQFQHYQFQQQSQNMNMMYYQNPWHYPQPRMLGMNPSNPFEDPFCSYPSNTTQHGNDLL